MFFGLFGGLFGIYGNISGVNLNGAVVSVRDIGPMFAGMLGGPVSGLAAGLIAGVHRLTMGGLTAVACVVATSLIGLICGELSMLVPNVIKKPFWAFLIGDVSGKGVPAALFMASSKIILQNCIRDIPKLSDAMAVANNVLCEKNDADMFVTLWVGVLDLKSGALNCVSAGHNPAALLRDGKAEFLKLKNGFVLAGMEDVVYKAHTLQLQKGDAVYLYTDGVTEASTKENALYGEERLLACLNDAAEKDVQTVIDAVSASVETFVQDNDPFDDLTMLCLRWDP